MSRLRQLAINEEGFVFDPSTGESFTVNATGLAVLKGLQENESSHAIAQILQRDFDIVPEEVEHDVMDFIAHLRTLRML